MVGVPKLWAGSTVVCLGGGPSLTPPDVEFVRGKARVIAINNAYLLAPWADVLYACDEKWWRWHREARDEFDGLKYSLAPTKISGVGTLLNTGDRGLETRPNGLRNGRNSGYQAINLAVHLGAARIVLLGYDMQRLPNGQTHWHPDHPDKARVPLSSFIPYFQTMVQPLRELKISVVNCSRKTALTCFPRQTLEQALVSCEVAA